MKTKRILSLMLALCLCLTAALLVTPRAQAAGYFTENDVRNVECSILSNPINATYVNAMMRYHILSPDNNYRIGRNLENGASVVFFFDGCSDNVEDPVYGNYNNYHLSAYCAVVQKVEGVPKVVFESENCTTIPDNPRDITYNDNDPVPTLLDGIYNIVSINHKGRYAALNISDQSYSSAPVIRCDYNTSYIDSSTGINIHARRYFPGVPENGVSAETYNSTGCLNVGLIGGSWKEYNDFIYTVLGVSNAIITTPDEDGEWTQCQQYLDKGVVVVDRSRYKTQLAAIYGNDNSHTATGLVSEITEYTDKLNENWSAPFNDISNTGWQFTAAEYAVKNNLMAGKGADAYGRIIFDPNSPISREEFVQVLYNAEGKPSVSIANNFPDVKDAWYKKAVLWANSRDIANGMGNGNFGVGMNITRQDLAMMLYKYAKLKGYSLEANPGQIDQYADGSMVSNYAKTAMNWAVKNRVLSGKGAAGADISTFHLDPIGTATRAECAAMLKNFMQAFRGTQQGCSHTAMTKTAASSATCTENGNTDYWHCANCGKYFADGSAATEISYADTVLEASGHSYQFTSDTATCTAAGTKTETCSNCGNEKTSTSPAKGHGETKVETQEATCAKSGYKKTICKTCGQTVSQETIPANGQCSYTTIDLPTAAEKAVSAGKMSYAKYATTDYCDYNTKICTGCNSIDISATYFKYSQREAAQMMLKWVNDLRAEIYGTHAYDLKLDDFCQSTAESRAKQLVNNFSHSGAQSAENIASKFGLYAQFIAWKNSSGHYANMINRDYEYFGYGYSDDGNDIPGAAFGCMTFG